MEVIVLTNRRLDINTHCDVLTAVVDRKTTYLKRRNPVASATGISEAAAPGRLEFFEVY